MSEVTEVDDRGVGEGVGNRRDNDGDASRYGGNDRPFRPDRLGMWNLGGHSGRFGPKRSDAIKRTAKGSNECAGATPASLSVTPDS